ncbi:hypothetical protein GGD63_000520 [Bradyrhizobium sp. cir1]|uniref:hypothetical protein n=1 Tax=Bradyrhizobium sp. cir1 TaxID=1445730 RepID=UPI0016061319|nr:hypothetical protein [Bradyrhizobium sp. cir1]MBB4367751.1 hypothetical protein [Bradyrhizobium sp. cir1]
MKSRGAAASAAGNFGGTNVETTANTMTNSRQGSHRKLLAEIAIIGLAHRGHVMLRERWCRMMVPKRAAASRRKRTARAARRYQIKRAPPEQDRACLKSSMPAERTSRRPLAFALL